MNELVQTIKNVPHAEVLPLADLVSYQPGQVVSRTLAQSEALSLTVFAFAQGEGLSTHSAPGDALVQVLDGEAEITIGGHPHTVSAGQIIVMPAGVPHGLEARQPFKMLLTLVR